MRDSFNKNKKRGNCHEWHSIGVGYQQLIPLAETAGCVCVRFRQFADCLLRKFIYNLSFGHVQSLRSHRSSNTSRWWRIRQLPAEPKADRSIFSLGPSRPTEKTAGNCPRHPFKCLRYGSCRLIASNSRSFFARETLKTAELCFLLT